VHLQISHLEFWAQHTLRWYVQLMALQPPRLRLLVFRTCQPVGPIQRLVRYSWRGGVYCRHVSTVMHGKLPVYMIFGDGLSSADFVTETSKAGPYNAFQGAL